MDRDEEVAELREALRAFTRLSWFPDAAPGPSCYMVEPVYEARAALARAGILLDGKSPFPSDNDGSIMITTLSGVTIRSVWIGGRSYPEDKPELVPEQHREVFRRALAENDAQP